MDLEYYSYYHIWRNLICGAFEITDLQETLLKRGFSLKLNIPVNSNDFRITQGEEIMVGTEPVKLSYCTFEKDLTPFVGRFGLPDRRTKEEIEYDSMLFGTKPSADTSYKFSITDNTILLGAEDAKDLVELVVQCGFVLQDGGYDILSKLGINYLAICDDIVFQEDYVEALIESLKDRGYNLMEDIRIEQPSQQFVPSEKRRIKVGKNFVTLLPWVFVAQVIPTGLIANVISKARPYWIALSTQSENDLNNVLEYSGLDKLTVSAKETSNKIYRHPIPDEVKLFVWKRDGGRCVRCGSQINLEYDHIIPLSMGGSSTSRNIQLLCEKCNRSKGANIVK